MAIVYAGARGALGDLQSIVGSRDVRPVEILRGQTPIPDIWYQYGSADPLCALGRLSFWNQAQHPIRDGDILVISSPYLYSRLAGNLIAASAAMAPAIFFLASLSLPDIQFCIPYSYAASMAACFGFACLLSQ